VRYIFALDASSADSRIALFALSDAYLQQSPAECTQENCIHKPLDKRLREIGRLLPAFGLRHMARRFWYDYLLKKEKTATYNRPPGRPVK
jgi:hypothetical protein